MSIFSNQHNFPKKEISFVPEEISEAVDRELENNEYATPESVLKNQIEQHRKIEKATEESISYRKREIERLEGEIEVQERGLAATREFLKIACKEQENPVKGKKPPSNVTKLEKETEKEPAA